MLGAVIMLSLLWKELRDQDLVGTSAVGVAAAILLGHLVSLLDNRWDGSTLEEGCFRRQACTLVRGHCEASTSCLLYPCLTVCALLDDTSWALHAWGSPSICTRGSPDLGRCEPMHLMWVAAALLIAHLCPC